MGFTVGNAAAVRAMYDYRTNIGYGSPSAVQMAMGYALDHYKARYGGDRRGMARTPARARHKQHRSIVSVSSLEQPLQHRAAVLVRHPRADDRKPLSGCSTRAPTASSRRPSQLRSTRRRCTR